MKKRRKVNEKQIHLKKSKILMRVSHAFTVNSFYHREKRGSKLGTL